MKLTMEPPECLKLPLEYPRKHMLGPGPSNCPPRVLQALTLPIISPLHVECYQIMDDLKEGLKYTFQTKNNFTMVVSASGNGGAEASLCNLIEPGDVVIIGVNGMWSERAAEIAYRYGAKVVRMEKTLGECFDLHMVEEAIIKHKPVLFYVTHAESSTGVLQPLEGYGEMCHRHNCLLVVDAVVSLGTVPLFTDLWEIDVCFAGSQKGLSCPPGLAPITFSSRAIARVKSRKVPPAVFYWDVLALGKYWGCLDAPQSYHHTCAINLYCALREGLAMIAEEGLEQVWARHKACGDLFHKGLKELGIEFFVKDKSIRLPSVTTICIPHTNLKLVSEYAMKKYNMELPGGTGPTIGLVIRIGLLGYNARPDSVDFILKVLKEAIPYARSVQSEGNK